MTELLSAAPPSASPYPSGDPHSWPLYFVFVGDTVYLATSDDPAAGVRAYVAAAVALPGAVAQAQESERSALLVKALAAARETAGAGQALG